MINSISEIFKYEFMQNALIAGLLCSIACGIIGSIVVAKRISSICGGIAHASFGGVGLGYLLNINPLIGTLVFGILASLGIGIVSKKTKHPEDTSIAIFWASGMSLGIIFISMTKGYVPDLFTFLFGNILAVSRFDLLLIIILDIIVCIGIYVFYKEILGMCFDEEFTNIRGIKVFPLYLFILILVSFAVVVLMKIVGIILVIALLSLPSALARKFSITLLQMIFISIAFNMAFIIAGLLISYILDIPTSATIILFASCVFVIANFPKKYFRSSRLVSTNKR